MNLKTLAVGLGLATAVTGAVSAKTFNRDVENKPKTEISVNNKNLEQDKMVKNTESIEDSDNASLSDRVGLVAVPASMLLGMILLGAGGGGNSCSSRYDQDGNDRFDNTNPLDIHCR